MNYSLRYGGMSNIGPHYPRFLSLLGNQYNNMSKAIIANSPLAIRRERPNTSLSEDESGPLVLSEPTGGNMVCDDVLVGVITVIGVARYRCSWSSGCSRCCGGRGNVANCKSCLGA